MTRIARAKELEKAAASKIATKVQNCKIGQERIVDRVEVGDTRYRAIFHNALMLKLKKAYKGLPDTDEKGLTEHRTLQVHHIQTRFGLT